MVNEFSFSKTSMDGLTLITPLVAEDERGIFKKYFEKQIFLQHGISFEPYEEMQSISKKGVLRGMHFQKKHWQDKLVRVISGKVYDVVVDLRKDSPTFSKWQGFLLSSKNHNMLYVPKGFAHGFLALEENTVFGYCCGDQYDPESDGGIIWNDSEIQIDWNQFGIKDFIVSAKDMKLPSFSQIKNEL